jgi:hypothetical protein
VHVKLPYNTTSSPVDRVTFRAKRDIFVKVLQKPEEAMVSSRAAAWSLPRTRGVMAFIHNYQLKEERVKLDEALFAAV